MTNNYCEEYREFLEVIGARQKLIEELNPTPQIQHNNLAMNIRTNFFWKYCQNDVYVNIISQILDLTYRQWLQYCAEHHITETEDLINSYCDIMVSIFKVNGIKGVE